MKPIVNLCDVSLPPILSHINLVVNRGQIITIIGPNGAGKTTLLKVLLGLIKPQQGTIRYDGVLKMGYMPQKLFLDKGLPLSVERFLRLSPHKGFVDEALKLVGALPLKNRSLHVLSGGEMQRVLLARAIMGSVDLLVLDEPGQGVDVIGQSDLYQLIRSLKERFNCAVVMVSHDLHFVHASSDHVICLNKHICCEGHPEAVKINPEYYRLFSDKGTHDLAPYHHRHDHYHA
ncbi:MAG: metal ABC transporter ATP-binding protein [Caedimonas sp.]|jgi:zinc transport system ATP-binding protein|nr:metal ABC transporter ATP-binding protein [Caedimonas sp.]